jgi:RNA polymerase sigma factor (TIGR02999 family)
MPIESQGDVTRLLEEIAAADDQQAAKRALFDHVYDELKQMAHCRMKRERSEHSWGTTALVHEVYLRLMKGKHVFTKNRAYFFGAAAKAMSELLREHARKRCSRPEGHPDPQRHTLLDHVVEEIEEKLPGTLTDLLEALDELKTIGKYGERQHEVVKLHFFGGLTYKDIGLNLGVSDATVERDWQAAQAWLYGRLKGR